MTKKTNSLAGRPLGRRQLLAATAQWSGLGALASAMPLSVTLPLDASTAATSSNAGRPSIVFDASFQSWTLQNSLFRAVIRLNRATGALQLDELRDLVNNLVWRVPAGAGNFPLRLELEDGRRLSGESRFLLTEQAITELDRNGQSLTIGLSEENSPLALTLRFEIYGEQTVLRHQATVTNRLGQPVTVQKLNFLAWEFSDEATQYDAFGVHQWVLVPREANFDPVQMKLAAGGPAMTLSTGSGGAYCAWLALRDSQNRGLFAGLEFNGRAELSVRQSGDRLILAANVQDLYHPLKPGESMVLPAAMVGLFQGDWDEAGYRTQRYVEAAVAPPLPDGRFPYIAWDSWGYLEEINEDILRENARLAAQLGIELFIVDLGWAQGLGNWIPDPAKFPSGLRALSDYVHDLGMKFGLHFAFSEADPDSPVLKTNPDWTSTETYNFHGGESICLGHRPTRDWVIEQAVALVRDFRVDWILQDGQTLVKQCTKSTHTHHPADSNWANSEEGLDWIVSEVRRRTGVLWENCANGGSMMTFKMARNYVTSITNDASGSLGSRQGLYGVTFPFPPRYADRYMPDQELDEYTTRSFIFGGPWIFMNRLPELTAGAMELAGREIALYKRLRAGIRDGRVSHLTGRPAMGEVDAMQSSSESGDRALAVVTREQSLESRYTLRWRALQPARQYQVRFETDQARYVLSGDQLMRQGVVVNLPQPRSAEVVYVEAIAG